MFNPELFPIDWWQFLILPLMITIACWPWRPLARYPLGRCQKCDAHHWIGMRAWCLADRRAREQGKIFHL